MASLRIALVRNGQRASGSRSTLRVTTARQLHQPKLASAGPSSSTPTSKSNAWTLATTTTKTWNESNKKISVRSFSAWMGSSTSSSPVGTSNLDGKTPTSTTIPIGVAAPAQPPLGGAHFNSTVAASMANDDDDDDDSVIQSNKNNSHAPVIIPATKCTKGREYMLDMGIPQLMPEWKKMFASETFWTDVSGGITVGCIAVPLSLAIALASGVPPEVGLVTAAVSGIAGGLLGGTTLAITGPAAAISLLVVSAVEQHGLAALPLITLGCGALQVASGVTRVGAAAKLVPISVIAGFTTGVGTLILTGQLPKALGLAAPAGLNPMECLAFIAGNLPAISPAAAALAVGTAGAMYALPKIHPKIPSALLAVGGATVATHALDLDVSLIGSIPSGLSAFAFGVPSLVPLESVPALTATIFLIYAMTSAESLLSCAALEKMRKTNYKHNPDQELIGQGVANLGSAFFMGMPVTSVIARSSLNVRLNAATRLPALVQSAFVFSSVVFMSQIISLIPMPALSGMLIMTGMGMLNPAEFKHCYAVQKSDTVPFLATMGGMLSLGLAEGIGIGCLSALAMNYGNLKNGLAPTRLRVEQQLYQSTQHVNDKYNVPATMLDSTTVWKLTGPINFVSMMEIDNAMRQMSLQLQQQKDQPEPKMESIVLDMADVTAVEFTGVEEVANRLVELSHEGGDRNVQMINCPDNLIRALAQCKLSPAISLFPAAATAAETEALMEGKKPAVASASS